MHVVQATRAAIGAALIVLCGSGISAADDLPITRRSIGVSFGTSDPWWHYRQSGPAETDKAISLELRLAEIVGLKTELGTATWTLTGPPRVVQHANGSFSQEPPRSDDFTATRVTASYVGRVRPHSTVTIVWMAGGGYYQFSSGTSDLNRRHRVGAHIGAGIEIPVGERFGVGFHALHHNIPGPSLTLPRSGIFIHAFELYRAFVDLRVYF